MSSQIPTPPLSLPQSHTLPSGAFLLDLDNQRFSDGARPLIVANFNALVVFMLLLIGIGSLAIIVSSIQTLNTVHELYDTGVVVQGEIVSHRRNSATNLNQGLVHYITYQFQYPDGGKLYKREQFVTKDIYDNLNDGTAVLIKLLPANPTLSTLTGENVDRSLGSIDYIMLIMGVIGLAVSSIYLVPRLPRWWVETQLLRRGKLIHGQLLHCRRYVTNTATTLDPNEFGAALSGNFFIEVAYRFHTADGKELKGVATHKRNDLMRSRLPVFGTPIVVLYLNNNHFKML